METALQLLKEKLKKEEIYYGTQYPQLVKWIDELSIIEKQHLEDSFDEGYEEMYQREINAENPFYTNGFDYYKKKFNK